MVVIVKEIPKIFQGNLGDGEILWTIWPDIWVFPIMVPPNHPFVYRVFQNFYHAFWGTIIFQPNKFNSLFPGSLERWGLFFLSYRSNPAEVFHGELGPKKRGIPGPQQERIVFQPSFFRVKSLLNFEGVYFCAFFLNGFMVVGSIFEER